MDYQKNPKKQNKKPNNQKNLTHIKLVCKNLKISHCYRLICVLPQIHMLRVLAHCDLIWKLGL